MMDGAAELMNDLAGHASRLILERFEQSMDVQQKADGSPVTKTDKEIDNHVRRTIASRFPDHGYIGEETGSDPNGHEWVWVCDPIDGTRPFTLGFPLSTFTLALVRDGEPRLAVIAYPFTRQTFSATKGEGCLLNGKRTYVSDQPRLAGNLIDVLSARRHAYPIPGIVDTIDTVGGICKNFGSAAVTAAAVARSAMVATIHCGAECRDAAAPKLIVEEAGGRVTDIDGKDQRYDQQVKGFVTSNGLVHDELISLIADCRGRQ